MTDITTKVYINPEDLHQVKIPDHPDDFAIIDPVVVYKTEKEARNASRQGQPSRVPMKIDYFKSGNSTVFSASWNEPLRLVIAKSDSGIIAEAYDLNVTASVRANELRDVGYNAQIVDARFYKEAMEHEGYEHTQDEDEYEP